MFFLETLLVKHNLFFQLILLFLLVNAVISPRALTMHALKKCMLIIGNVSVKKTTYIISDVVIISSF